MLSILIGHSYFQNFDPKQVDRGKPYPPLATLQVAALLRRAGHQVSFFDAMLAESTREFELQLHGVRPSLVLLYEDNYNYLSKMCLGKMRSAAGEMIAGARLAGAKVVAAGSDVSDAPEVYLRMGADVVLRGEGLASLQTLLGRLDADPQAGNARLAEDLGDASILVGEAVVTGEPVESRGQVIAIQGEGGSARDEHEEAAAWDLVDMERYRAAWTRAHGYFSLNMAASKGCSFRCAWCAKPIWGNRYLQRSATAVAAEMVHLKRRFGPDHVWFADDIFGFRAEWVNSFARALQAEDGGIPFNIQTRADLITPAMAQALEDAGCREAWIGAESGSQRILDAMNKGTSVQEILTARERLKAHGIRVGFFIQLGYLGEQLDDLLATRALIEAARPDDIGVSVSYPLPGTPFHELVREQLGEKTHWEDSRDLAMMFQGTYDSRFYRSVRDLLHRQVDLERLDGADTAHRHRQARDALRQQWDSLIASEAQYRSRGTHSAHGERADVSTSAC
jgi:anaerobic magnesium-protoporphyrin IX monomethyl ester cyclase